MTEIYTFDQFKRGGNCDFGPLERHFPIARPERSLAADAFPQFPRK